MRGEHSSLISGIGDGRCQGCLSLWEWTHKYTHLVMESDSFTYTEQARTHKFRFGKFTDMGPLFASVGPIVLDC